jgi:hypothetical protein
MTRDGEDESVGNEEAAQAETRLVLDEQETVLEMGEAEAVLADEPVDLAEPGTEEQAGGTRRLPDTRVLDEADKASTKL